MHRRIVLSASVLSQARRAASNSTKATSYVQSTAKQDAATPIPDERVKSPDHNVPPGPFPSGSSAKMYEHFPAAEQQVVDSLEGSETRQSSTTSSPAHLGTTREGLGRAGKLKRDAEGVGSSSAVRFRSAPGEMSKGGDGGLGLMREGKDTDGKTS